MKKISIERLLTWAFTEELCKVPRTQVGVKLGRIDSAWSKVGQFAELGTLIDQTPNQFGVIPDFSSDALPHPDALRDGAAVRALNGFLFDIPDTWRPFPDWDDPRGLVHQASALIIAELRERPGALQSRHVVTLVTTSAVLRRGPDWYAEKPRELVQKIGRRELWFQSVHQENSFGKMMTVEVDGYDYKSKRPKIGAFQKYELEWSIRGSLLDRLDWRLWQQALAILHQDLSGQMMEHSLADFVSDMEPWARLSDLAEDD